MVRVTRGDVVRMHGGHFFNDTLVDFLIAHFTSENVIQGRVWVCAGSLRGKVPTLDDPTKRTQPKPGARAVAVLSSLFWTRFSEDVAAVEETGDPVAAGFKVGSAPAAGRARPADSPPRVARSQNVARWFPGEELFQADFVLVPVCSAAHWSLIVATHPRSVHPSTRRRIENQRRMAHGQPPRPRDAPSPARSSAGGGEVDGAAASGDGAGGEEDDPERERGMLLHFDSLGLHNTSKLCQRMNRFLHTLWKERCAQKEKLVMGEGAEEELRDLEVHKPKVRRVHRV